MQHERLHSFVENATLVFTSVVTGLPITECLIGVIKGGAQIVVSAISVVIGYFILRFLEKHWPRRK